MENEADSTSGLQKWRVAGEIRELLWSLRMAETRLELARRAVASARNLENDVSKRVDAGELARTDLLIVEAETLAREVDQTAAVSNRDILLSNYQLVTGLAVPPADLAEERTQTTGISDDHPALQNALGAARRAFAERDQVRGEKRANPLLTLGSKTERPGSDWSYDTALVVQVNVPLGTSSHAAPGIAAAERQLAEVQSAALTVRRDLETALNRASREIRQSEQALQLAEQQQQLTAEGLRLTQRAFELGESDLFTLLQARKRALETERDLRIQRDELGRAVSRYNQALGVIPQ
jgi:outer membrane protein TolC